MPREPLFKIDPDLHREALPSTDFSVTVVGAGSAGSVFVFQLMKLCVPNVVVYDNQQVEARNLNNQFFGPKHVGQQKVFALNDAVGELTGNEFDAVNQLFEAPYDVATDVLVLAVDSMDTRIEIVRSLRNKTLPLHVVDMRIGSDFGWVYSFNPGNDRAVEDYLSHSAPGSSFPPQDNACRRPVSAIQIISAVASRAVQQVCAWASARTDPEAQARIVFEQYEQIADPVLFTRKLKV